MVDVCIIVYRIFYILLIFCFFNNRFFYVKFICWNNIGYGVLGLDKSRLM